MACLTKAQVGLLNGSYAGVEQERKSGWKIQLASVNVSGDLLKSEKFNHRLTDSIALSHSVSLLFNILVELLATLRYN